MAGAAGDRRGAATNAAHWATNAAHWATDAGAATEARLAPDTGAAGYPGGAAGNSPGHRPYTPAL